MKLNFFSFDPPFNSLCKPFRLLIKDIEFFLQKQKRSLNIVLGDNALLHTLNKRHRGKDSTTDVLSFSYDDFGDLLGEVIISYEKAKEQARKKRHSLGKEMNILFVHGVLHVLGYDHERNDEYRVMKLIEKKVLNRFYERQKRRIKK